MTNFSCIAPIFVPASRPERFSKAAASGADAVIIDLEDAVAEKDKEQARASLDTAFTDLPVFVRINGADTAWHQADIEAISALPDLAGVIFPKAEIGAALTSLADRLNDKVALIALIETAQGLADARQLAQIDSVKRLAFGSIDFCADMGCSHSREVLLSARSELVLASRLGRKIAPLDGVTATIDDPAPIEADARYARSLGFGGKLCIHPRQITPIFKGFRPDDSEIAWAHRVLSAGEGAQRVDGAMVDEPVRIRARAILARAEKMKATQ
ncbi:HpcH/HpaI aldolase [Zymomonas mobilis subsp. mobilis ZM4 = ATCC 31821]|uniref:HpcH/HpaI aldolase n=2 Tax=Zymomonas mobilis subsp. mobilis TaxID=120045 RepID=Q5NQ94_ZYMMO|nr:CoA ester lyase [Zymomonas mobilis]AAV89111.1 HpcH/HpaI aldolase [Zymomonas mobilis subsp. mobilis ZM4 = ATCC 31821]ACV75314.1 HpcH/HpaI aldolase [Zymomonas mobilis subsp. mobilis NCIMB 11163]AEH62848.1 HpcH/HpaI aldolase [Zymomonas mobilis subsp. mobilis ATCC 10988]AHB10100.1 citrate lyase beta subunit [Zymomonas mobilis subsp. mobilis str. CP4 = NRRL B-14023]AHJ70406.1 Citrate lyase subunit beta-like protein [Zymomonas mobilis subsp. mobilis NRRL B-12526]